MTMTVTVWLLKSPDPPPPVSNECLAQRTLPFEPYFFGTQFLRHRVSSFRHRMDQVPNGMSNEHSRSNRILYCSLDTGGGGVRAAL